MNDWTATVRGLTIGAGTPYRFTAFPDVLSTATVRIADMPRPHGHGVIAGSDLLSSRLITFELTVGAASRTAAEQLAADLAEAFAPADTDEWLDVRLTGTPSEYAFRGRCRGAQVVLGRSFLSGRFAARCQFAATDPLRYGPEQSVLIDLSDVGDGFILPVTLPAVIDGTTGAGTGSAPNSGSMPVHWSATLTGPLTNPRLTHVDSGAFVKVLATIANGDIIELDSRLGVILVDGETSRPDLLAPGASFFDLDPGGNSIRLTADAGTGTALVTWRPGAA